MKKILSIFLVMTLIFSMVSMSYAQKPEKLDTGIKNRAEVKSNIERSNTKESKGNIEQSNVKASEANKGKSSLIDKFTNLTLDRLEKTDDTEVSNETQRVLVVFKGKVDKSSIEQAKGRINREYNNVPALAVEIPVAAVNGLGKNPNVASIEIDTIVELESQTEDWGIIRTEAEKAWESSYTGKGIKVAIVDTGIANHEDINISGGVSFTSYTTSYVDDNGHGTHVAGIIGAKNKIVLEQ